MKSRSKYAKLAAKVKLTFSCCRWKEVHIIMPIKRLKRQSFNLLYIDTSYYITQTSLQFVIEDCRTLAAQRQRIGEGK